MKYIPPAEGPYESGLNAEAIYEATRTAFRRHATKDFYNTIKSSGLPPFKLWNAEPIKKELVELVADYLFGGLNGALENLRQNIKVVDENYQISSSYFNELVRKYDNLSSRREKVSADFTRVTQRYGLLVKEINKIEGFNKPKLIRSAAQDSFNHLSAIIYSGMQLDLENLRLIQS